MDCIICVLFSKGSDALKKLEFRVLAASVIAVYLNLIAQLKKKICKSSVITETDDTRAALSRAAKDINKLQFIFLLVDTVYLHLIDTVIYCTEIFVIRCGADTVYMRTEVTLCHASKSFVENTVHNASKTSVFMCMYNRYLTIMITSHIKISSIYVCCKIASSHSVDINTVDTGKITVLISAEYGYTLILDGVQIFAVLGNCQVRSIADFYLTALCKCSVLYIYVVYLNSFTGSMGISSHVSHVLLFSHKLWPPAFTFAAYFYVYFITKFLQGQVIILLSFVQFFMQSCCFLQISQCTTHCLQSLINNFVCMCCGKEHCLKL